MADRRVELVESAYNLGITEPDWLGEVGRPLRESLNGAVSCFAFEVDRRDGKTALGQHDAEDPEVISQLQRSFAELPHELLELFFAAPLEAGCSARVLTGAGYDIDATVLPDAYARVGFKDVFSMSAFDPLGGGVIFGVGLRERISPPAEQRELWTQVAAHVAAGFRLRRQLRGRVAVEQAGAVLRSDGVLEHAEPELGSELRALLSEAVRRVEQARTRGRPTQEALALWQALIAGSWSLVDHFEGGGRRCYVAIRNAPEVAQTKALSRREAEVVAYIACGTGTRAVAYALGVDLTTVRGYLRTAMAKLGVRTRAELITLWAMLNERTAATRSEPPKPR